MVLYLILALVLLLSLVFTYSIGFQDGSGVAASALAAKAMTRKQAVALVSIFEFTGAMLGGSAVAKAMKDITNWPAEVSLLPVLASGLTAAILWNFVTRRYGIPSSSTHALVGGIIGGVVAGGGGTKYLTFGTPGMIIHATGIWKIILSLFLSPLAGFLAGFLLFRLLVFLLRGASSKANDKLNKLEWIVVPLLAFGHGANATQKTMGVMVLALFSAGFPITEGIPHWVRLSTALAVSLGILSVAPLIIRRIGGIYNQRPLHGFVSQLTSSVIVTWASIVGGPLSTSQVVASSVVGVGSSERVKGVHWQVAKDIVGAWFLTIPSSAFVAFLLHFLIFSHLNLFL